MGESRTAFSPRRLGQGRPVVWMWRFDDAAAGMTTPVDSDQTEAMFGKTSAAGPTNPDSTATAASASQLDAVRLTVRVSGWVQGVGFRWTVMSVAQPLGLLGYAENLDNGDVEVVAEGPKPSCQMLLEWLSGNGARTPRLPGRVESLKYSWGPATGRFRRFSVR